MQDKDYILEIENNCRELGLTFFQDVVYATRGQTELHLQIITHGNQPLPTVLFIPGSAWHKQFDLYKSAWQLIDFASLGFNVAIVEYRCTEDGGVFPAHIEDAKSAIRFMRANCEQYGVDTDNVFIWGSSSGGHTALIAGMTCGTDEFMTDDLPEFSSEVNAIADYYGPVDVNISTDFLLNKTPGSCETPEGMLIGGYKIADHHELTEPTLVVNYIDRDIPPVIIFHGDSDSVVNYNQSVILINNLQSRGKEYEFHTVAGADHGSEHFWTKEIFSMTACFFKKHMKKAEDILIVVDMQNDFIDGALGTAEAVAIVPKVAEKIKSFEGRVIFTRDTHGENYLETQEGSNLPVKHCIAGTEGWQIRAELDALRKEKPVDKPTFGSVELGRMLTEYSRKKKIGSITLIGLCTDICVISNAMLIKAALPEVKIIVDSACCAGVTPASHAQALEAMKVCQIEVI